MKLSFDLEDKIISVSFEFDGFKNYLYVMII